MDNDNFGKYRALYVRTAHELIEKLKNNLKSVNPTDRELLETIHRDAHSLKGQSLFMGYQHIGQLSRMIEYILRDIIGHKLTFSSQLLNAIIDSVVILDKAIQEATSNKSDEELAREIVKLSNLTDITLS